MNCREIEPLLLAEPDGVLTKDQQAALSAHAASCPACRDLRARLDEGARFLRTDAASVPVPDVNEEWRTLRARLHGETTKPAPRRPLAPVIWFGVPLAAAAALTVAYFAGRPVIGPGPAEEAPVATIAYVDQESGWLVVWASDNDSPGSG